MACISPTESTTTPRGSIAGVPDYGWRVPLSYSCDLKCSPFFQPRLSQLPQYVGLSIRWVLRQDSTVCSDSETLIELDGKCSARRPTGSQRRGSTHAQSKQNPMSVTYTRLSDDLQNAFLMTYKTGGLIRQSTKP